MKVKEIRSLLEQAAPEAYAMGWDNSGLILGRTDKEVKKILITVDVDDNTVDQALLQGADLVLSHHPLVFQAGKRITDEEFIGRRIGKLLRADVFPLGNVSKKFLDWRSFAVLETVVRFGG